MYKKKRNPRKFERHVIAVELPLRMRAANLGGIVARNEKLHALKASALIADLQRVYQMLGDMPEPKNQQVVATAVQLQTQLAQMVVVGV